MLLRVVFILQFLKSAFCQTCPSDQTPTDALGPFYVASAPISTVIGPEDLLQDPSNRLEVTGNVLSVHDCTKGLSGVTIEIWYAGEEGYRDDEYRGMFVTEECGKYNYTQTFPFLYTGRPLHVHIRASRGNEELLVTQMYFVGQEVGYRPSRSLQAVEITEASDGSRSVVFDIFVDAEGDSENCSSVDSPVTDTETPVVAPTESINDESHASTNPEPSTNPFLNTSSATHISVLASAGCLVLLSTSMLIL